MNRFIKKIQNFAFHYQLWQKGAKIIIGVSGGADSVCLLDILVKLAPKYDFHLSVAHINYGLRGQDSDKDEKFVKNLAEKYGLTFNLLKFPRHSLRQKFKSKGENLENALRQIRYDFFEKVRREKKFDLIAVAHNQNDQSETALMRILRGAGLQGLAAMRPRTEKIIRPLLNTSRRKILEYLKTNHLTYRVDLSNKDTKFLRNRIRHRLIPYLEKNYNPVLQKKLAEISLAIADDYAFLAAEAEKKAKNILSEFFPGEKATFNVIKFRQLPTAIKRQIIRNLLFKIKTNLTEIETAHIEEILKIAASEKNKIQKTQFHGLKIERRGDKISIVKVDF